MILLVLEISIMLLLIYLPFAAGGVTAVSVALFKIVTGLLLMGWLFSLAFQRSIPQHPRRKRGRQRRRTTALPSKPRPQTIPLSVAVPPAWKAILAFTIFIVLQLVPWPAGLVKVLSPATFALYAEAASNTVSTLPAWLPLSIVMEATETELGKFVAYALLFLVVINVIRTPAKIRRVLTVLCILGGIEAVYGLSQVGRRISGTFVNQNHFAGYLELLIPLIFGMLLAHLESPAAPGRTAIERWFNDKTLKTLLIGVLITALSLAVFLSGSRGGIISVAVGMAFFCVLAYTRRLLRKWVRVILVCAALVFVLALFASPESILQRVGALAKPENDINLQYRWNVWKNSLGIVRDFPIVGSGLGTFSHLFARYQKFPSDLQFTHAENDYIQLLTETGFVGIGIVFWAASAYGINTMAAWRRQRSRWSTAMGLGGLSALVSMAVHSSFDFNLHIPSNAALFTLIAALTYLIVHFERCEAGNAEKVNERGGMQSFNPSQSSSAVFVCRTKNFCCQLPRLTLYALLGFGILVSAGICIWSMRAYAAFLTHQQFLETIAMIDQGYLTEVDAETTTFPAWESIRYDGNNADYHFALGSYFYRMGLQDRGSDTENTSQSLFDEAEQHLQRAVRHAPVNPWYYYELARVSLSRGPCEASELELDSQALLPPFCPVARYFLAALTNAPHNTLIRWQAGEWYTRYFPKLAGNMMEKFVAKSLPKSADEQARSLELARFLYDSHLDYQSDQELYRFTNPSKPVCDFALTDEGALESGYDDGILPDWRAFLTAESIRVKKVLCVPENLDEYTSAALRFFMNHGGQGNFITNVWVNEHLVHEYFYDMPLKADWHEIPIDIDVLRGLSEASVYIRVIGATRSHNALQVWGDADRPTRNSVLNFQMTADVSTAPGIQTGEYMIRLVLRKDERESVSP